MKNFKTVSRIADGFRRLALCLTLMVISVAQAESQSQANSQGSVMPPPKEGLVPVHVPDLATLETNVREHLQSLTNSTSSLMKDTAINDLNLSEAYGSLGQVYQAYALPSPAEECYLNAHRLAPKDFRWTYLLGNIHQQENRIEEAINYYKLARSLRPDYLATTVNLGNLYLQKHLLKEARASFKEALELDAKCAAARYGLGQAALSDRKYTEAVGHLEQALAEVPDANRIHYALAMSYRGLSNLEKAQAHLEQQGPVGIKVSDPLIDDLKELVRGERIHLVRGRLAFNALRFKEAAEEFRKAANANPASVPARVNLGTALAQTGEFAGAIEQFKKAIKLDPENSSAHYNLGILLARQNLHEEAIIHLRTVTVANPNDASARFHLGRELVEAGRQEEALTEFARIVEADADNENALLEQVKLLMELKRYGEAMERLKKGHALFPQKGQTVVMLAYLLASNPQYDLRDGAKALELARLVYGATGSVNHGAIVAMALAELGRCDEAAEWQRQMITAAERQQKADLARKLKIDLQRYEKARPCRPVGESPVSDTPSRDENKKP